MAFGSSLYKNTLSEGKKLTFHWIHKALFIECWKNFTACIATADWSKKQTSQSLFNDPNWGNLYIGTRIAIGRVLRYFVDRGWLPLVVLNPKASGTKYYGLIGG